MNQGQESPNIDRAEFEKNFRKMWDGMNRKGKRDFVKKVMHRRGLTQKRMV